MTTSKNKSKRKLIITTRISIVMAKSEELYQVKEIPGQKCNLYSNLS